MDSKEVVRRTLDYDWPERVARSFGGSDFAGVSAVVRNRRTPWKETGGGRWEMTDEWGNTWARLDTTSKGEVVKGVLDDLDHLAAHQERGKITFWCPVDIQKVLPSRNAALIRAKAEEMLDKLWRGRGGFVAGRYEDEPSIGLEPQWQDIVCETFLTRGRSQKET